MDLWTCHSSYIKAKQSVWEQGRDCVQWHFHTKRFIPSVVNMCFFERLKDLLDSAFCFLLVGLGPLVCFAGMASLAGNTTRVFLCFPV